MLKKLIISAVLLFMFSLVQGQVSLRDSVITWSHFDYTVDAQYHINSWHDNEIVEEQYQALVIENEYIKLTLVPEFGGRIISFIYKPTGHEQLYQNPVGAPYGINEGNFYYNWLMVWGGIFPTFPEPEHGKSWLLPWAVEVLHESTDSVWVQMALKDTLSYSGKPGSFNNGTTGLTCLATVKLAKGQSSFDLHLELINDDATSKKYEYWTCNTWSPGSEIGNTFSPLNSEMIVPIEFYQARWSPGNWIVNSPIDEKSGLGNDILKYENLRFLENWKDMGIAYAYPEMSSNFYGVINHENEEGIFRVSDNSITPGLKFWTWGADAIDNNPQNFYDNKRSYIELWSGHSGEFFEDATIAAQSSIAWTERFFATVDLKGLTYANEQAYFYLMVDDAGLLNLNLNTLKPGQDFEYSLTLDVGEEEMIFSGSASSDAHENTLVIHDLGNFRAGEASYTLQISAGENEILNHSGLISLPQILGSELVAEIPFQINKLGAEQYELQMNPSVEAISLLIYDLQGKIHSEQKPEQGTFNFTILEQGLYIAKVETTQGPFLVKFVAY